MEIIYSIIEKVLPFSMFSYDFMKNAFAAILFIAPLLGILGTMAVNNSMAFFSDALGHSALTGIAIGVALGLDNHLVSMLAFGIALSLMITKVKRAKTASADTVISVFSSVSAALGLLILSRGGRFGKYSIYLIGDILSITPGEILWLAIAFAAVLVIWYFIWNKLLLISVNSDLAASRGVRTGLVENIFVVVVAVVVMLSIKWVGILLINSLLILPAAAARNVSRNSRQYLAFSACISLVSSVSGLVISFYSDTAAGAAIVLVSAVFFFISYIFRRK